jgi:hypothetical protein
MKKIESYDIHFHYRVTKDKSQLYCNDAPHCLYKHKYKAHQLVCQQLYNATTILQKRKKEKPS